MKGSKFAMREALLIPLKKFKEVSEVFYAY